MEEKSVQTNAPAITWDSVQGTKFALQLATSLAGSTIIPEAFQNKPANVFIALNMAHRMNADPLAVMQNMYIVYGNPSFSAKFLIACFNACGRFTSVKYEFLGKPGTDTYGCRAYATERATGEKVTSIDVTMAMAKAEGWVEKKGSKWKTMPQLMLQYRAATFLIRTVAPEISMGLQTYEELQDMPPIEAQAFNAESANLQQEVKELSEKSAVVETPAPAQEVAKTEPVTVDASAQPASAPAPSRPGWATR